MQIYDISQEVFGSRVYPGDPSPARESLLSMEKGDACNLTAFSMCAHNGTHVDAPFHFYQEGKTVDQMELSAYVGWACVVAHTGEVTAEHARHMLETALLEKREAVKRILIKGKAVVTAQAAAVFAEEGISLLGNESQTVGPEENPEEVHLRLLGAGITLLEGICLGQVPEGVYFLCAAPLKLGGADGAPCRAVLLKGLEEEKET